MKTTISLLFVCIMGAFSACNGQTSQNISNKKEVVKKDTAKSMNLLDEQTKILNQMFTLGGMSDKESPTGGSNNYLDMVEKMDCSAEMKEKIREMYDVYDTGLDPSKAAEFEIKVAKMLEEAMAKGQSGIE